MLKYKWNSANCQPRTNELLIIFKVLSEILPNNAYAHHSLFVGLFTLPFVQMWMCDVKLFGEYEKNIQQM